MEFVHLLFLVDSTSCLAHIKFALGKSTIKIRETKWINPGGCKWIKHLERSCQISNWIAPEISRTLLRKEKLRKQGVYIYVGVKVLTIFDMKIIFDEKEIASRINRKIERDFYFLKVHLGDSNRQPQSCR